MKYFSYAPETGMEFHELAEDAQYAAETAVEGYSGEDGYPEEMTLICWGEVKQSAKMTNKRDAPEGSDFEYLCDYELSDEVGLSALVPSNPAITAPPSAAPVDRVVGQSKFNEDNHR